MRNFLPLLTCLFSCCFSSAQRDTSFHDSNNLRKIHSPDGSSTSGIAEYINSNYKTDLQKVQGIYSWVTSNIRYDKDSANHINLGPDPEAKVTVALRRRRGVCENYAAIFNEICTKCGLTSFVINGYTKQGGFIDKTGHAWCAVMVDNKWNLFDPTWDAGTSEHYQFFMMPPSEFIETHMPFDPIWQLLDHPISNKQFYGAAFRNTNSKYFNYPDSIAAYLLMDSLGRFTSSEARIRNEDEINTLVKNHENYVKMNIEMIHEDHDVDLYNQAIAELNKATADFNKFIGFRNNQFQPEVSDQEILLKIDDLDNEIISATKKLDLIDKTKASFQIGTDPIRERIAKLSAHIYEQKEFVKKYLNTPGNNRKELFYSSK